MAFKKGQSGNPKGRPKKGQTEYDMLMKAIKKSDRKHKQSLIDQFVEMARKDAKVMIALMKKIVPDRASTEIKGDLEEPLRVEVVSWKEAKKDGEAN